VVSVEEEDLTYRLIQHEKECELRYERIEERLNEQKQFLLSLDTKIWGLAILIIVTPFIGKLFS
tara:strand:- start:277 stop:468 length:192 start_codon:yes stop_codon:yes gene_type:complete